MKYEAGFIGTGVMGGAIARSVREKCQSMLLANVPDTVAKELASELNCDWGDNFSVANDCKYIFLAVKPQIIGEVCRGIAPILKARKDDFTVISIAAGVSLETLQELLGGEAAIVRVMPNICATVGAAVMLWCPNANVGEEALEKFKELASACGMEQRVEEKLIDSAGALSGCGPAFAFVVMQALADGAVACGVDRRTAARLAAMTMMGSAKLALESGKHFEQLKDEVCSPAGSTIEGVEALEKGGVRAAMMDAVRKSCEKNKALGKTK
jgi:pyrroline-5-carboxylate reductase